jgi:hypothetical protein
LTGTVHFNRSRKMNRLRKFKPELFTILEIPECEISERELSGFLLTYINKRRIYQNDGYTAIITLTPRLQKLTGLYMNRVILTERYKKYLDWWELIHIITKRWKA